MTKKHFIALADAIRSDSLYSESSKTPVARRTVSIDTLVRFCESQNPHFDRHRWLGYIAGDCGSSGDKVKERKS